MRYFAQISKKVSLFLFFIMFYFSLLIYGEYKFKNPEEAIQYLEKNADRDMYELAIEYLVEEGKAVYPEMLQLLDSKDWRIRRGVYNYLDIYWSRLTLSPKTDINQVRQIIDIIKKGCSDPIPAVRANAVKCLIGRDTWLLESPTLRKEILNFLKDFYLREKDYAVKKTIYQALIHPLHIANSYTENLYPEEVLIEVARTIAETQDMKFFYILVENLKGIPIPLTEKEMKEAISLYKKEGIPVKPKYQPTPKKKKASLLALRMLTKQDFGDDYIKWERWFSEHYESIKDPITGEVRLVKRGAVKKKKKWEAEDYIKMLNLLNSEDPEERKNVVQVMITPPPEAGFTPQVRLGIFYLLYDEDQYVRGTAGMSLLTLLGGERITIKEKEKIAEALSKAIKIEKTKRLREGWAFFLKGYVKEKGIKYRKEVIINNLIESLEKGDSNYLVEEVSGILSLLTDRKPPPRIKGKELARWWIDKLQEKNLHKIEE